MKKSAGILSMTKLSFQSSSPSTSNWMICGMIAPVLLFLVSVLMTYLRPSYNHLTMAYSQLGAVGTPFNWIINIFGFVLVGIISLLFFYYTDQVKLADDNGRLLFLLASLTWLLTGILPLSFTNSLLYWSHILVVFLTVVFAGVAMILLARTLIQDGHYQHFGIYTIFSAYVIWITIFSAQLFTTGAIGQLLAVIAFFQWYFAYALLLWKNRDIR